MVYIVPFTAAPLFRSSATTFEIAMTVAVTVVFFGVYLLGYWARGRELYLIIAVILIFGTAFMPLNLGAGVFFIYAGSFSAFVGPPSRAVKLIAAIEMILAIEVGLLRIPLL